MAFDLLTRKAWTARELTRRLVRRHAPREIANAVVIDLVARGYVDDAEFARRWVETRAGARLLGRARLRRELRGKGLSADVVETAIGEALPSSDDESCALAAARQRWPALKRRDAVRAPTRLAAFLGRRGYPAGIVARVVRTLSGLEHDTASDEDA